MDNYRWSFEWKNVRWGNVSEEALLLMTFTIFCKMARTASGVMNG